MVAETRQSQDVSPGFNDKSAIRVIGKVKRPLIINREKLCRMPSEELEELPIFCGSGTPKGRLFGCRGVLLENVIRMAEVITVGENDTKKMFIVVSAHDGHTVVFSWQEIFNTLIGGGVMILTERDGKPLGAGHEGLELISSEDYFTGSRYVKGLKSIELAMVE